MSPCAFASQENDQRHLGSRQNSCFVGEGSAVGLESAPGEVGVRSPACCWNGSGKESKFGIIPSGEYLFELIVHQFFF